MLYPLLLSLLLQGQSSTAQFELSAGGGLYKGDPAAALGVSLDASTKQISFGLTTPFTFALGEEGPTFVEREWDSPTDYAHTIRYLTWRSRTRFMKVGLRIGETHNTTMAFGGLVSHANYLLFLDTPHTGAQFGLSHENVDLFGFLSDFVQPTSGGGTFTAKFSSGLLFGGSLFGDPQLPLSMADPMGEVEVDQNLGVRLPFSTQGLWAFALHGGVAPTSWLTLAGELLTLDPSQGRSYGGLVHLRGTYRSTRLSLKGEVGGGVGGAGFLPFFVGPFYLLQREEVREGEHRTLREFLMGQCSASAGFSLNAQLDLALSKKSDLSLSGAFVRNRVGDTATLQGALILSRRLTVAAYGALQGSQRGIFSLEGRVALPSGWFVWVRAKRLFTISRGSEYYALASQLLAGVGYRHAPEERRD